MNFYYKRYKKAYSWVPANKTAERNHKEEKAAHKKPLWWPA